jgi:hypothetical protein
MVSIEEQSGGYEFSLRRDVWHCGVDSNWWTEEESDWRITEHA